MSKFGGILAGAIGGFGKGLSENSKIRMEEEVALNKMTQMKKLEEEILIAREERIAEKARTPGTKEYEEMETARFNRNAASLKLDATRDAKAEQDVLRGGDAQFSDGSHAITGDDGIIRKVRADGKPLTDKLGKDGHLAGQTRDEFEASGMTKAEKLKVLETEGKISLYGAQADAAKALAGSRASGGSGSASKQEMEFLKMQLTPLDKRIETITKALDEGTHQNPAEAKQTLAALKQQRNKIMFQFERGKDAQPTEEEVQDLRSDYKKHGDGAIKAFDFLFGEGKARQILGAAENGQANPAAAQPGTQKPPATKQNEPYDILQPLYDLNKLRRDMQAGANGG
jgi:hypothetical protein